MCRPGRRWARQIELGGQVRILSDADLDAVEADDQDALGRPDMEDDPPAGPSLGHVDVALVDAGRVQRRRVGRVARERHLDVGVVRAIPRAGHRPDARDVRLGPVRTGLVVGAREELETPAAIEREPILVRDAVHREPAEPGDLGEGPRSCHAGGLWHAPGCVGTSVKSPIQSMHVDCIPWVNQGDRGPREPL